MEFPETYIEGFHDPNLVRKMTYNRLGKTGLKVSYIALGTAQFGALLGTDKEEEAIETVIKAVKSGINYIDTAPYYAEGKAEIVLGKALQKIPRKSYYLATKVGRYTTNIITMFDFSARKIVTGMQDTLKRLNVSYVDVIQIHDIEFAPNFDVFINETFPTLQKFKESGVARFIGISGYAIEKLRQLTMLSPIKVDLVLSYCRFTLFDNILQCYIPYFVKEGIGVVNAAVLGMGLLTEDGPPRWHPVQPTLLHTCIKAIAYCKIRKIDIARLATCFPLAYPGVDTNIVGIPNLKCLEENLDVAYHGLTPEECHVMSELKKKVFCTLEPADRNWENIEVNLYWQKIKESNT